MLVITHRTEKLNIVVILFEKKNLNDYVSYVSTVDLIGKYLLSIRFRLNLHSLKNTTKI